MKRVLLTILFLPTLGFAAQQSSKPTIVHAAQSELESSLRHYETMTSEEERVTYLNEIFAKETADNRTDSELELLAQVLRGFYKVQRYQWLEKLKIPSGWRKCLVAHNSAALKPIFEVIDDVELKKNGPATAAAGSTVTEEPKVEAQEQFPLAWQDLHPYEMLGKVLPVFKQIFPDGIQLENNGPHRSKIFGLLKHYTPFNRALIYAYLSFEHMKYEAQQTIRGCYITDFREGLWYSLPDLTPEERRRISSFCAAGPIIWRFAFPKAIQTSNQQSQLLLEKIGAVYPKVLAPIIAAYAGKMITWGVTIPQVLEHRENFKEQFGWEAAWAYGDIFKVEPKEERTHDKGTFKGLMLTSMAGLHLVPKANARRIYMQDNMIESLDLNGLPANVKSIGLRGNLLQSIVTKPAAASDPAFPSLRTLDFDKNLLTGLPEGLAKMAPQLQCLAAEDNQLSSLPSDLEGITGLTICAFDGNSSLSEADQKRAVVLEKLAKIRNKAECKSKELHKQLAIRWAPIHGRECTREQLAWLRRELIQIDSAFNVLSPIINEYVGMNFAHGDPFPATIYGGTS